MLCEAPAKLIITVPNRLAGIPTETLPVEPTMSSRLKLSLDSADRSASCTSRPAPSLKS